MLVHLCCPDSGGQLRFRCLGDVLIQIAVLRQRKLQHCLNDFVFDALEFPVGLQRKIRLLLLPVEGELLSIDLIPFLIEL